MNEHTVLIQPTSEGNIELVVEGPEVKKAFGTPKFALSFTPQMAADIAVTILEYVQTLLALDNTEQDPTVSEKDIDISLN